MELEKRWTCSRREQLMKRIDEHWEGLHFGAESDACTGIGPIETCNAVQKRSGGGGAGSRADANWHPPSCSTISKHIFGFVI